MTASKQYFKNNLDLFIMSFILFVLFVMPIIFVRVDGEISWKHIIKIWEERFLLIPVFAINHWLLVPLYFSKEKFRTYFISALLLVGVVSFAYYEYDKTTISPAPEKLKVERFNRRGDKVWRDVSRPDKIPAYANLIMFSFLLIGVDTGLLISKRWQKGEQEKLWLEKEMNRTQLQSLQGQVSPHFFMNTLNNIYALIDHDSQVAKASVMKLSKLMRYMLYESVDGKISLQKEFEFLRSYIELMKLRTVNNNNISFIVPERCLDTKIPVLLFISYIENAFKYSASNDPESFINIVFEIKDNMLCFTCRNTIAKTNQEKGGIGMKNTQKRLKLLFDDQHKLVIKASEKIYHVELNIPLPC